MNTEIIIILAIAATALIACFWALIINEITFRQRLRLIDIVYDTPASRAAYRGAWNQVSNDQHFHRLLTFRDPIKLYGQALASAYRRREAA